MAHAAGAVAGDDGHDLALLQEPAADRLWALRQAALARLLAEGLAQPLRVRSRVRRAAERVLRGR
jgi:ribosomal protein S3